MILEHETWFREGPLEKWWEVGPFTSCRNLFFTSTASGVAACSLFVLGGGIFYCRNRNLDNTWTGFKRTFLFISVSHSRFALLETFSNEFFGQYRIIVYCRTALTILWRNLSSVTRQTQKNWRQFVKFQISDYVIIRVKSEMKESVCFGVLKWLDRHLKVFKTNTKKLERKTENFRK